MIKIALVDDDASVRSSISRLLRSHGYQCFVYDSAESALADSAVIQMACILIDIELLGMNGFDFRDRLRDLGSHVPCVFVTAHCEFDFPGWEARIGDTPCLTKPVEEHLLIRTIEKLTLPVGGSPAV